LDIKVSFGFILFVLLLLNISNATVLEVGY